MILHEPNKIYKQITIQPDIKQYITIQYQSFIIFFKFLTLQKRECIFTKEIIFYFLKLQLASELVLLLKTQ